MFESMPKRCRRALTALTLATLWSNVGAGVAAAQSFARSETWHTGIAGVGDGSGPEARAEFGAAVAAADFNCDGHADLAIGAPWEDVTGASDAGAVYVLLGTPRGLETPAQRWHETQIGGGQVSEEWEHFGETLAAGDFDGNGCDDLAIGAVTHIGADGNVGAFHVLYGAAGLGLSSSGATTISQDTAGVTGEAEWADFFAWSLAAGDFDGDGFGDLAVGVPGESLHGTIFDHLQAGAVQVFYGSSMGITVRANQWLDQSASLGGVAIAGDVGDDDRFGDSLATGDWNGDGAADLAIGVTGDFADQPGAVEIVFGVRGYGLHGAGNFLFTQGSPGVLDDDERMDHFGSHLGSGDFDGDGSTDLLVGVWSEDDGKMIDTGAMHLFPGSASGPVLDADTLVTQGSSGLLEERERDDRFGGPFATGDLNGDGAPDLAVAAPEEDLFGFKNAGVVHLLFGVPGAGLGVQGNLLLHQAGEGPEPRIHDYEEFGDALAMGDFDGDGHDDLAVGVRLDVVDGRAGAGSVDVFYGFGTK